MVLPQTAEKIYESLADKSRLTEIRLRVGKKIVFCFGKSEKTFESVFTQEEANRYFSKICDGAPYSRVREQREGYVTVGGFRVGFCGSYSFSENEMRHIETVSSFCIRVPHEIKGCARKIYGYLFEGERPLDTLIISPPGCGKTTLLRDAVRMMSNDGFNVALADERGEVAAVKNGIAALDVGARTDTVSGVKKSVAMKNMIRAMKPDVVAADELSGSEDLEAIEEARRSGVSVLATMHGSSAEDAVARIKTEFDRYIVLRERGETAEICGKKIC